MKDGLIEILVIADESGSMRGMKNDVIGGYNEFLETHQKMAGEAKVTFVKFNSNYQIVHNGVNVKDVPKLTHTSYMPGGSTALLDAVGRTIDEVGKRLANTPESEKPEKVMVVIMTDGEENCSREYSSKQIADKIKEQTDTWKWEFTFIGADQNAWDTAQSMGIHNSATYDVNNTGKMFKSMSNYTASTRSFVSSKGKSKMSMSVADSLNLTDDQLDQELKDSIAGATTTNTDNTTK